ncbi:hypothetical protein HPP92_015848 [Vanilla planifolia]|uniref:HMG box domain-containing protein n=1 Tax=Vanilla planifolia TaxID=51239 RepID=A0A835QIN5_VANPL|nr:hypothetical protein HPP92_015848 [Vanilla planifolia]
MKDTKSNSSVSRKADGRLTTKKAAEKTKKSARGRKDPNKPKRPPSAFFVFMKEYKEKNPSNKLVSVVGKAGGDKWKSMSDAEKAPYVAKAEKLKADYQKQIRSYNGQDDGKKTAAEEDSSDKSSLRLAKKETEVMRKTKKMAVTRLQA